MGKKIEHKIVDGVELKRCSTCGIWLPLNKFNMNKAAWDKLGQPCKDCKVIYCIWWRENNLDYSKQHYIHNREKILIRTKLYNKKHIKKISIYQKQYDKDNCIKISERKKLYRKDNHEKLAVAEKQYDRSYALRNTYYSYFLKYEELRIDINDNSLFEVRCAYCGKWMKPTNRQVKARIKVIEGSRLGESRFYCSENCKQSCPIYGQSKYPKGFKKATSREVVPLLRQLVLERDNYTCQKCGATTETAQLHVHHEKSYTLNKIMANDPDNCLTLCKDCHKWIHSQEGCKYSDLKC